MVKREESTKLDGCWVYLNNGYAEEVEICDTSELFKQIFRQEVQRCVLGGNNFIITEFLAVVLGWRTSILRHGIPNEDKPVSRRFPCTLSLLSVNSQKKILNSIYIPDNFLQLRMF